MISRNVAIAIGILILVILGFLFVSTMTGNVITGSVATKEVNNEYFRVSDFGSKSGGEVKDGVQDSGGSK